MSEDDFVYVTFGHAHTHRIDNVTLDCDVVAKVQGGRERAHELFGTKFAFSYRECPDLKHFPRGVVEV